MKNRGRSTIILLATTELIDVESFTLLGAARTKADYPRFGIKMLLLISASVSSIVLCWIKREVDNGQAFRFTLY
jgi:hypothetical protein